MRKYRAWSKDRKKYIPQGDIDQLFIRMDGRVFWRSYSGFDDITDKVDIEFSTGRFDKKRTEEFPEGKEIYQGDIVSRKSQPNRGDSKDVYTDAQVVYDVSIAVFELTCLGCEQRAKIGHCIHSWFFDTYIIEVIGTIHDNPEAKE